MKKSGCFFTTIVILTIVIGILFYIGKKYWPEFKEYGKQKILSLAENDLKEKIEKLQQNEYKDSLMTLVNSKLDKMKELSFDEMEKDSSRFLEKVKEFIDDKVLDSDELSKLTELAKEYERQ